MKQKHVWDQGNDDSSGIAHKMIKEKILFSGEVIGVNWNEGYFTAYLQHNCTGREFSADFSFDSIGGTEGLEKKLEVETEFDIIFSLIKDENDKTRNITRFEFYSTPNVPISKESDTYKSACSKFEGRFKRY